MGLSWKYDYTLTFSSNFGLFSCLNGVTLSGEPGEISEVNLARSMARRRSSVASVNEPIEVRLKSNGLTCVDWHGKCHPDEFLQGSYDVGAGQGGTYALVFDNTFSKSTSKTVHFSQRVVNLPSHSSRNLPFESTTGAGTDPATTSSRSPFDSTSVLPIKGVTSSKTLPSCISDGRHLSGVMLKKRRKKLQGYARRYFSLDYKYGVLNYYTSQNSSILRGTMPIKLCVVSAREQTRDIYIDSGMELWNVRPLNSTDFITWASALDAARLGGPISAQKNLASYSEYLQRHAGSDTNILPQLPSDFYAGLNTNGEKPAARERAIMHSSDELRIYDQCEGLIVKLENIASKALQLSESSVRQSSSDVSFKLGDPDKSNLSEVNQSRRSSFWKRKSRPVSISQPTLTDFGPTDIPVGLPADSSAGIPADLEEGSVSKFNKHTLGSPFTSDIFLGEISKELFSLVHEFKTIVDESKAAGKPIPRSPVDADSLLSDEFFDAEENGGILYFDNDQSTGDEYQDVQEVESTSDDEDDSDITHLPDISQSLDSMVAEFNSREHGKNLYPLTAISEAPIRRNTIPAAIANPPSFLSILRKNVGKDMSTVAMPVAANEPLTILQRFTEIFESVSLIEKALAYPEGSPERIMHIAVFGAVFIASSRAKERSARKPFNPLLGETFELVRPEQGLRVIAEKVCHRPSIMAMQAETANWTLHYSPTLHQQIWGKSIEINNKGTIRLFVHSTGEVYEWVQPTTFLRNIIAGEKYSEPTGSLSVVCSNRWRSVIDYKVGGMFSGRSEELRGKVFSSDGKECSGYSLEGKWTESIDMIASNKRQTIWKVGPLVEGFAKRFGYTQFAANLNEITNIEKGLMATTDSRLRPDQRMYENGDSDGAEVKKLEMEQHQRDRRTQLEKAGGTYSPVFFELEKESLWVLKKGQENYWERRKRGDWKDLVDIFA